MCKTSLFLSSNVWLSGHHQEIETFLSSKQLSCIVFCCPGHPCLSCLSEIEAPLNAPSQHDSADRCLVNIPVRPTEQRWNRPALWSSQAGGGQAGTPLSHRVPRVLWEPR